MTKTQEAKRKLDKEWDRVHKEYSAVVRSEFRPGTKVKFQHGRKWISGEVVQSPVFNWDDNVRVKNLKTGKERRLSAHWLEFDSVAST